MLVKSVMSRNVVTASPDTSIIDAIAIMKEHGFRRLPVVDDEGRLVGLVTQGRLENAKPAGSVPLVWQVAYAFHHTTVKEVMTTEVITVKPDDTVEQAVAKAQANKVGTLIVVEKGRIVGICTTNDFFYRIVNPVLGIGMPGTRMRISGAGDGESAEKIIGAVNRLGVGILVIWTSTSSTSATPETDLTLQLDTEDVTAVAREVTQLGYEVRILKR